MDEEGRPTKLWARLLFQPRQLSVVEWRLGLLVVGVALLLAWLIWWTFIPRLIGDMFVAIFNGVSWFVGLFSGGGGTEVATPVLTPGPTALPSPSPSVLPSPSPSPSPFLR
ncbi:MAG: hypothetical protein U0893_22895 [Chloroflexota bacterium]